MVFVEWICAGLIIAAIVIVLGWAMGLGNVIRRGGYRPLPPPPPYQPPLPPTNNPYLPPPTQPPPSPTPLPSINTSYLPPVMPQFQPNPMINYLRYYHGTSIEAAEDIWRSGLWLSDISPAELWMTDDFDTAKYYAEDRGDGIGYILVLDVDPSLNLINFRGDIYYIELDDDSSQGKENYYQVDGVYVIQMLDLDGNILRSK